MFKKFILIFLISFMMQSVQAYEDCIITTDSKITNINIEDNTVIDVFPIITIMNEKNTLIVHPLKSGKTRFCVLKNDKSLALFEVEVTDFETRINTPNDFETFTIDKPFDEFEFELDDPPIDNLTKENGRE